MRRRTEVMDERDTHAHEVAGEDEVSETHPGPWYMTQALIRTIGSLIAVVMLTLETALGFRFAFEMAAANRSNGFVEFIYDATYWMVSPFEGIASTSKVGDNGVFNPATLIAMAVVAAVGMIFLLTLWALSSAPAGGQRYTTSRVRHDTQSVHED